MGSKVTIYKSSADNKVEITLPLQITEQIYKINVNFQKDLTEKYNNINNSSLLANIYNDTYEDGKNYTIQNNFNKDDINVVDFDKDILPDSSDNIPYYQWQNVYYFLEAYNYTLLHDNSKIDENNESTKFSNLFPITINTDALNNLLTVGTSTITYIPQLLIEDDDEYIPQLLRKKISNIDFYIQNKIDNVYNFRNYITIHLSWKQVDSDGLDLIDTSLMTKMVSTNSYFDASLLYYKNESDTEPNNIYDISIISQSDGYNTSTYRWESEVLAIGSRSVTEIEFQDGYYEVKIPDGTNIFKDVPNTIDGVKNGYTFKGFKGDSYKFQPTVQKSEYYIMKPVKTNAYIGNETAGVCLIKNIKTATFTTASTDKLIMYLYDVSTFFKSNNYIIADITKHTEYSSDLKSLTYVSGKEYTFTDDSKPISINSVNVYDPDSSAAATLENVVKDDYISIYANRILHNYIRVGYFELKASTTTPYCGVYK